MTLRLPSGAHHDFPAGFFDTAAGGERRVVPCLWPRESRRLGGVIRAAVIEQA